MIFVSVLTYELGKEHGLENAAAEFLRQVGTPDNEALPAARVVARLRDIDEVQLYHGAGTCLAKARSRAAQAFLESRCDRWVMVDDDVETNTSTLERLLSAAGLSHVSVLPCLVRGSTDDHRVNVVWGGELVQVVNGVRVRSVKRAGCGLMVVPRAPLERAAKDCPRWIDDDGTSKAALFYEMLAPVDGADTVRWLGEDYSFCARLGSSDVPIVGLVEGVSVHDGRALLLTQPTPAPPRTAARRTVAA